MRKNNIMLMTLMTTVIAISGCYSQKPPEESQTMTPVHPKTYSAPLGNNPSSNGITNSISHGNSMSYNTDNKSSILSHG